MTGTVSGIFIAPASGAAMVEVQDAHAVPGRGLEGDRYYSAEGTFSQGHRPDGELTLIESEAVAALLSEDGLALEPGEARRNVVTEGVALNHLVGREFLIGDVRVRGHRLCEPCSHLQTITGKPGVLKGLMHRGGLRAEILSDGIIRRGDQVRSV